VPRAVTAVLALALGVGVLASPALGFGGPPTSRTPGVATTAAGGRDVPNASRGGPSASIDGLDVSHHQGSIDWPRVARAGKQFAYIRASAGTLTEDARYDANIAAARRAGLAVGSYHYANPSATAGDAENEAAWFLEHASFESGDLIPVLDLEVANGLDPDALIAWTRTWLERVTAATGVRPMIYTTPSFWSSGLRNTDWFARNGDRLWIAHWTKAAAPTVPAGSWGGQGWTVWQSTSSGSVPGISGRVDLDRLGGTTIPTSLRVP
jgi:GH25 family lysozyme M1 (1,4-beta-N-acetylmuramidase)